MWASEKTAARRRHAFTLVEVMVATSLLAILTAAVLSSFIFILRAERSLANYAEMNTQARRFLELLGRDARSATDVTNTTATAITMSVPANLSGTTQAVTYAYDASAGTVTRSVAGVATVLVKNVSTLTLNFLNSSNTATTSLVELKQVQVSMHILRTVQQATTSEYVISAQYTLRSKAVSH
ncbi:MAG: prepilin-type N-terminal cleavage/methylation domain-containing protein [Opitutae bacterium]|nr:prepilin-type N-terminal cleavage/methylation domain-containing protein [Opitutae bacterium]